MCARLYMRLYVCSGESSRREVTFCVALPRTRWKGELVGWNTSLEHLDTGFLEGAGVYWYEDTSTGEWILDFFQAFLEGVIAASTCGKSIVLHFSPGPSFPPIVTYRKPRARPGTASWRSTGLDTGLG